MPLRMRSWKAIIGVTVLVLVIFLIWRFIRPMNIFIVSAAFERPIDTTTLPATLRSLRAEECAVCHRELYDEWSTSIHSQAWTDPYFQVDWRFDDQQQICKNCHIPLDRQQEYKVVGFRDNEKWDPILEPNPDFDARLQHEGVTCAVCHVRDGKILGPFADGNAPHPVAAMGDPNQVCVRCHVVSGERWDTFFRFPPCGTVAEIRATHAAEKSTSGEVVVAEAAALNCVECHMPLVQRPLVPGGAMRAVRRHVWRGGHDPDMVKRGLTIELIEQTTLVNKRRFVLTITNTDAAHFLPTGTPDRHLSIELRVLNKSGNVLQEDREVLKRTVMWRPFIVDLWDTRLQPHQPRDYALHLDTAKTPTASAVEAVVRYHLLDEARRRRIGYQNAEPISYEVYRARIALAPN